MAFWLLAAFRTIVARVAVDVADDPLVGLGIVALELDRESDELDPALVVTEEPAPAERGGVRVTEEAVDELPSRALVGVGGAFRLRHDDGLHRDLDVGGRHPRVHSIDASAGALEGLPSAGDALGVAEVVGEAVIELAVRIQGVA